MPPGPIRDGSVTPAGRATQEMTTLLTRRGMAPLRQPITHHQAIFERLGAESGPMFDAAYAAAQVGAHVEAVAVFTAYSQTGQDAEMRALAARLLPTLQHHKHMAVQLLRSLPIPGGQDRPPPQP